MHVASRVLWLPLLAVLLTGLLSGCDSTIPASTRQADAPEARRAGGDLTIFSFTNQSYTLPGPNLEGDRLDLHLAGDAAFDDQFVSAPAVVNAGLGPAFVRNSCAACHTRNGRTGGEALLHMSVPGAGENGNARPVPGFGVELQNRALFGVQAEGTLTIEEAVRRGQFADGTTYTLRNREPHIEDPYTEMPDDIQMSLRMPRPVFGLGLLEAVPDATLRALADEQAATNDGITGAINRVWNEATQQMDVGRFGWKATQPTLLQQNADAYNLDMGITNPMFPEEPTAGQPGFDDGRDDEPEISRETLEEATFYVQTLAVPARRNLDDSAVRRGERLFDRLGCATCHRPKLQTGSLEKVPEVENQTIYPYTDLLLHDMGPGLSDERPLFDASGREWRTPPLWGIGLSKLVNPEAGFLHDGRARTLTEAILWHGGEAERSKNQFKRLSEAERNALIAFLESL